MLLRPCFIMTGIFNLSVWYENGFSLLYQAVPGTDYHRRYHLSFHLHYLQMNLKFLCIEIYRDLLQNKENFETRKTKSFQYLISKISYLQGHFTGSVVSKANREWKGRLMDVKLQCDHFTILLKSFYMCSMFVRLNPQPFGTFFHDLSSVSFSTHVSDNSSLISYSQEFLKFSLGEMLACFWLCLFLSSV